MDINDDVENIHSSFSFFFRTIFTTGEFVFFDTNTYLGVSNIGSNSFYYLFDPFFIPILLCPREFIAQGKATVDSILAITYTDASALEMKEKLRETLSRITNEGHSELGTQLQLISNSDICTIDAFCARLIRKYFFTVNINNDYKIIESNLLEEYKKIAINS